MKIIRAKGTRIVELIEPFLVIPPGQSKEGYVEILRQILVSEHENTLVLAAFAGDAETLLGFLVAYSPPDKPYVLLSQAWCTPEGTKQNVSDTCFLRLIHWTENQGKQRILMETNRSPDAFQKRWRFKPIITTMEFDISDEGRILERLKGDKNGQQQSENNVESVLRPEAGRPESVPADTSNARTGSDTVQRTAAGQSASAVPADEPVDTTVQSTAVPGSADLGGPQRPEWATELRP